MAYYEVWEDNQGGMEVYESNLYLNCLKQVKNKENYTANADGTASIESAYIIRAKDDFVLWHSNHSETQKMYEEFSVEDWRDKVTAFEHHRSDKPSVYIDVDGTLGKWYADAKGLSSLEEIIDPKNHYFRNIETHPFMVNLAEELQNRGFDVCILTATDRECLNDRFEWIKENLPFIPDENIFVCPVGADKTNFVKGNANISVLIDDYNKNLEEWSEKGGVSIKAINTVNSRQGVFPEIDMTEPEKSLEKLKALESRVDSGEMTERAYDAAQWNTAELVARSLKNACNMISSYIYELETLRENWNKFKSEHNDITDIYTAKGYYHHNLRGLSESIESSDWSTIEEVSHNMLSDGLFVEITNMQTGMSVQLDPEIYFEEFEGEFPVKPQDLESANFSEHNEDIKQYSNDDVSGYTLKVENFKVNLVTEYKTNDEIVTPYIYADIADGLAIKEVKNKTSDFVTLSKAAEQAIGKALETFAENGTVSENTRQWCKDTLKIANEMIKQFEETKFQKPVTIDMPNGKPIEIIAYPYNYGQPANSISEIEGYDTDSDVIAGGGSDIYKYASEIVNVEALQKENELGKVHLQEFFEKSVLPIRDIPYYERTQEQQEIMSTYSDLHKDYYFHRPHNNEQDVCYQHYLQKEASTNKKSTKHNKTHTKYDYTDD